MTVKFMHEKNTYNLTNKKICIKYVITIIVPFSLNFGYNFLRNLSIPGIASDAIIYIYFVNKI